MSKGRYYTFDLSGETAMNKAYYAYAERHFECMLRAYAMGDLQMARWHGQMEDYWDSKT